MTHVYTCERHENKSTRFWATMVQAKTKELHEERQVLANRNFPRQKQYEAIACYTVQS